MQYETEGNVESYLRDIHEATKLLNTVNGDLIVLGDEGYSLKPEHRERLANLLVGVQRARDNVLLALGALPTEKACVTCDDTGRMTADVWQGTRVTKQCPDCKEA